MTDLDDDDDDEYTEIMGLKMYLLMYVVRRRIHLNHASSYIRKMLPVM